MAEPTSGLTLKDLLLRVAKAGGIAWYGSVGTSKAMVPLDAHDFDKCLNIVNDGIRLFTASAPSQGWRWQNRLASITFATVQAEGTVDSGSVITLVDATLSATYDTDDDLNGYYCYDLTKEIYAVITDYTASTGTVIIGTGVVNLWHTYDDKYTALYPVAGDHFHITNLKTVEGDKTRYFLPDDFAGDVSGRITYAQDTGHGSTLIDWVDEATIRENQETSVSSGYPLYAAVRPSPVRRKWELVVDPSPTAADTVIFPYRVGFNNFQALTTTATAASSTYIRNSSLVYIYPDAYFLGWTVEIISGTGQNSYGEVIDYDGTNASFTVTKWLAADGVSTGKAPETGSIFYVYDGYKHPAGIAFDQYVLSACLAVAEMEFEDLQLGYVQKFYQVDLPKAYEIDARSAPRKLGPILPSGGQRRLATWNDVGYLAAGEKSY